MRGSGAVAKSFILIVLASLFIVSSTAVSVGTAPGAMNIGELERGQRYAVDFYLMTTAANPVVVNLAYNPPKNTIFESNTTSRYTFIPMWASEEDMSDWISFQQEKVIVDPSNVITKRFPDGSMIKANAKAKVLIDVPRDAEPGYHAFEVQLNPEISGSGAGQGVQTFG
ncbi:MAG: hypothetical protein SVS85_02955, partial [Candidatus Nanohaloarchaea archaeon]|nr:hypothetical protein [Candidatus Nanohaloarchaea archaeon]